MTRYIYSLLLALSVSASSAMADSDPVEVTLLAAKEGPEEGELLVGVKMKMEPGWHIYWRYPGEIGKPTQVQLKLPDGFQEEPLLWPLPHVFKIPSSPDGYGYEGEVMLVTEVKAPATKGPASSASHAIEIEAEVKYLACSAKACLPGKKELKTKAVLGTTATLDILKTAKQRMAGERAEGVALHVQVDDKAQPNTTTPIKASLRWDGQPRSVEWFPLPPSKVKVKNVVSEFPEKIQFDLELKDYPGDSVQIPSIFAITSTDGKRLAVEQALTVPLSP